jgi:hypothetical protein
LLYQKDFTQSKLWQAFEAQRNISLSVEVVVGYHDPWEAVTEEVIRGSRATKRQAWVGRSQVTTVMNFWDRLVVLNWWAKDDFALAHKMDRNPFGRCVPRRSDTRRYPKELLGSQKRRKSTLQDRL